MKKITILLTLCAMALITSISAQAKYRSVTVHLKDNTTVTVDLSDDLTVRFNDIEMTIMGSTLDKTLIIPKENIHKFEHHTLAAIDAPETDITKPVLTDGSLQFSNLPAGSIVEVYDLAGRLILSEKARESYMLDLGVLTSGTYIITVNGSTYKFAVK